MCIDYEILTARGGVVKMYKKGQNIFMEGEHAHFYFQIIEGKVKMFNTNLDGKEFTQAEFNSGCSFGEPVLFIDELYPSTAMAVEDSKIIKLSKGIFFEILNEYPSIQKKLIEHLARRIYNNVTTARDIINNTPASRIVAFLIAYKKKALKENEKIEIPFTRQEIANFTGLRVETVIRTLTKMKADNLIQIENHKLIF